MCFEAKHRYGKEVSSVCRNFRNICKTIANHSQQKLANDFLNRTLFQPLVSTGTASPVILHSPPKNTAEAICQHFGVELQDEVYILSSCQLGHYNLKPGSYVVGDVINGVPQFNNILLILSMLNNTHLVTKCSKTNQFDEHYYSYSTEEMSQIVIIPVTNLAHPHATKLQLMEKNSYSSTFNTSYFKCDMGN